MKEEKTKFLVREPAFYFNYNEMEDAIKCCIPFKGSSVSAIFLKGADLKVRHLDDKIVKKLRLKDGKYYYVVFSYTTVILIVDDSERIVYFDNSEYSRTTSKIQNIICRIIGKRPVRKPEEILFNL